MTSARALLLLAGLLFVCNIWGYDLWAPDEPFFGEGARAMLRDGHWLVSHINGVVNSHKPPLFFWLIALLSAPFGEVLSLTARLPSVLAAVGTVALTLRLGRRFSCERTAVLAGFVLAVSYMFWDKARSAQIDAVLCFFIWVALSAFEAFRAGDAGGRRAGMLFFLAAALAVLAKGPVGLLLPLGVVLVTLVADRRFSRLGGFAPITGPLVFVAVTGAWVVAVSLWGPADYSVWGALREHFVERGVHGMHHAQPFWYYAKVLPAQLMPWIGLIPGALFLAWVRRESADRFLLIAALFVIVFFSVSTEKRTLYVLPAFPAFALMTARMVAGLLGWESAPALSDRWIRFGQVFVGGLLTMMGLILPVASRRFEQFPGWMPWLLAVPILVSGLLTLVAASRRNLLRAVLTPAVGLTAAYLFAAAVLFPALNPSKSSRAFALQIETVTADSRAAGHSVLACGLGNLPTHFALFTDGLYTLETDDPGELAGHLAQEDRVFAVIDEQLVRELPEEARRRMVIVDRTVLNSRQVLLVANGGG